jgi:F0F1-type ATP synthase assembly protein I
MLGDRKQIKKNSLVGSLGALSKVGSFGFIMAAAIFMGYYIGSYLDRKLDTEPWFLLLLLILSIIGAFIKFVQSVKEVSGKKNKG